MMGIEIKSMRFESTRVGEIFFKFIPIQKKIELHKSIPTEILGHKRIFDYYGISCNYLNSNPPNGITEVMTRDGPIRIYWDKRAIVAPLKYYSSQNNSLQHRPLSTARLDTKRP